MYRDPLVVMEGLQRGKERKDGMKERKEENRIDNDIVKIMRLFCNFVPCISDNDNFI